MLKKQYRIGLDSWNGGFLDTMYLTLGEAKIISLLFDRINAVNPSLSLTIEET